MKKKIDYPYNLIIYLAFIAAAGLLISYLIVIMLNGINYSDAKNFCENIGYDDATFKLNDGSISLGHIYFRCEKKVLHKSGLGYITEYSGDFKAKDGKVIDYE